ncbi:ArsC family reductase [Mesorhizobium sp. LHD-90]|uniref:ArsC family reductase n=1 Tax=Mesorhizobium sp. LHD-90 TaxID=3071414 RepID=UPI0027E0078C|nr:ArsC family reductase [Mesorhizobium sp. LHD-90]MDQ6436062.1 ArsC family reductase [Mesorhizobium sp. LHD-90]
MPITIYGIKTCDTMKKAWTWLDGHGRKYRFHDYRAEGLDEKTLRGWVKKLGWEKLLNKSSTTFRELPDADKAGLDEAKSVSLMLRHPTMIKRPVLDIDGKLTVGFKPEVYEQAVG